MIPDWLYDADQHAMDTEYAAITDLPTVPRQDVVLRRVPA